MSQIVEAASLDATQLFARAVECWKESDALFKKSGDLFAEAEASRKNSIVKTIETSRLLCEAFAACKGEKGGWGRLFDEYPSLPDSFSKANCDRLRPIWGNETVRNARTNSAILRKLPHAKFTLAVLADKMTPEDLAAAIERGAVKPGMTKKAAERLVSGAANPRELASIDVVRRALNGVLRQLGSKEPRAAIGKLVREVVEELFPKATA